jgi:hypothetical protein
MHGLSRGAAVPRSVTEIPRALVDNSGRLWAVAGSGEAEAAYRQVQRPRVGRAALASGVGFMAISGDSGIHAQAVGRRER